MQTHSHVDSEIQDPQAEPAEGTLMKDGDFTAPSSSVAVTNQKPAKRPTRQWAAWTRQEEGNFFNALRQVGKNFEKITCRVQSKSKNQVRHYYYRLVRRMNKLLSPALCLDAKNSKDTNAAMLRWWSLLEKHSCTASKLHLKPRRFKIFIEALENQLLKDRNKSRRKRPCPGEKFLATPSTTSVPSNVLGNDVRPVKLLFVDSQNTQRLQVTKGHSLKPNMSTSMNFSKDNLAHTKSVRQKRRPGLVASAAYKRWEKAAMAGVSLVADAAEQLERTSGGEKCSFDRGTFAMLSDEICTHSGKKDVDSAGNNAVCHLPSQTLVGMCPQQTGDLVMQPHLKLKLQLFPIDEVTRQALMKDGCNPHLELTLSSRKRISSVFEHLNRKWGNLSIASGELTLFPYSAQQEDINITSQQRWTAKDAISSAADVYSALGSPANFRLRYGWFSNAEPATGIVPVTSPMDHSDILLHSENIHERSPPPASNIAEPPLWSSKNQSAAESEDELPVSSDLSPSSLLGGRDGYFREHQEVSVGIRKCGILSAGEWADSLTNISVGDLLSEASKAANSSFVRSSPGKNRCMPQENPLSCDSFDDAVAAHIASQQLSGTSVQAPLTSIWNAEETCDGFSFKMVQSKAGEDCRQTAVSDSLGFQNYLKELTRSGSSTDPHVELDIGSEPTTIASIENDQNDPSTNTNLNDIYWPDSLGPLDLEVPSSSRYQSHDHVFGESISFGGLSRIIASSLDAFQNCSFFGIAKKESSTGEACGGSIHLDTKFS